MVGVRPGMLRSREVPQTGPEWEQWLKPVEGMPEREQEYTEECAATSEGAGWKGKIDSDLNIQ